MKRKFLYAVLPVLSVGLLGAGIASAHGMFGGMMTGATPEEIALHQNVMFEQDAQILGVSVDEIKEAWASGKTVRDLAKEKGISDEHLQTKMKEARTAQLKAQLQTLVDKGVITQAQADKRLTAMQTRFENGKGLMGGRGHHGR